MDIAWEGILMVLLIAIILIFIILSLLNFFQPQSSFSYYSNLVSMVNGACSSTQSQTNQQFNNPNSVVFQIYDNQTTVANPGASCDSLLTAESNIFNPQDPYDSNTLAGNYDLCYAQTSFSHAQQVFLVTPTPPMYYFIPDSPYNPNDISLIPAYKPINYLGVPAILDNATNSQDYSLTLSAPAVATFNPSQYTFELLFYSNYSASPITLNVFLGNCPSKTYTIPYIGKQPTAVQIANTCDTSFSSISINVQPGYTSSGTVPPISYELNITAQQVSSVPAFIDDNLADMCFSLIEGAKLGYIVNGTLVCNPIKCGSTSFVLADTEDRPFLEEDSEIYSLLAVQPAESFLQLLNPNSEELVDNAGMAPSI